MVPLLTFPIEKLDLEQMHETIVENEVINIFNKSVDLYQKTYNQKFGKNNTDFFTLKDLNDGLNETRETVL